MSNYLIIWNKTKFSTILVDKFGSENIISNYNDFINLSERLNTYDLLIALCELNWSLNTETTHQQELSGIELVKKLRRDHNFISPVLFVSFLPLEYIFNAEREIITAVGHDFFQLPATPDDFKTFISKEFEEKGITRKLSVMELNDIKSFYCSKEGILSHELHQLNAYLNYNVTAENSDYIYCELENSIRKIHELFLVDATNALVSFQVAFSILTKENITEAVNFIIRIGNKILLSNSTKTNGSEPKEKIIEQFRWKVLLLDDQINEQDDLVILMKANNINVICVNNALDAKRILVKDWNSENCIMVVIADYRLYENTVGVVKRHQKIQGYQFLKEIASSDHLVRLVAFSGLQRKFLLASFKHYNIRTEVKSKTDYLSSEQTRQLFCDEIIELAEENLEVIEALPSKCAGFEKTLKEAYKELRMHPDYYKMESNISLTAKEYVCEIQQQISDGVEIKIGAIENIKSPLAKTKKDQEAFFKRFNNYLVARRIALWLYASNKKGLIQNVDSRNIAEILTDQKYPTDAYRQIISTNLGLSLDDFPKNITIEERRWLQYEMQLNIFRDINLIEPVFNEIEKYFKEFLTSNNELKESIIKNRFSLNYKYKQANYSIDFSKDFTPELKTATDVRVLFLIVATHFKMDKTKFEQIKPLVSRLRHALFVNRDYLIYLKNLFQYFNTLYRILNKEQTILLNVSSKVKDKSIFTDKSKYSINNVYERTFELLINSLLPNENDTADVFSVFITGEGVLDKLGKKILLDKVKFFAELSKAINNENNSLGYSFNEAFGNNKFFENDNEDENLSFFIEDQEYN